MIAEENWEGTHLGKRVKLLGLHQVLIQDFDNLVAANWSKSRRWQDIAEECNKFGF